MSEQPPRSEGTRPVITPPRVVVALCLIAPFVAMLWVGSYARVEPTVIGIPFFYWYQLFWVFASTGLTSLAYVLVRRERRARKGGAPE
ncbi:DUF3311 domain-containing protein [Streptomyces sp. bgisy100]|uniref:DUF3311 domain-containing protein n=1 Tax=Streptomyces sp. bgisy100 TaxID=3413783 RepID=UPI003D74ECEB